MVYEQEKNSITNIFYYNKETGLHTQITNSNDKEQLFDFDGSYALYYRSSSENRNKGLYVYDFDTEKEIKVSEQVVNTARLNNDLVTFESEQNIYLAKIK
jgi:hypothetical protein